MQQVEPLCRQLTRKKIDPSQVAARPGEAGDKTEPDWVLGGNKGDRDRRGCRLGSGRRGGRTRGDYGDLSANQFGRQLRQSIVLVLGEAVDDCYVLALHIADVFEAQAECAQTVRHRVRRSGVEQPDYWHRRLLRARRERPCGGRAAEQRDEIAAFHSITSSASSRKESEIVRPSALAVLRFTLSSNFVGACVGRSAGFAPFRIRSTYEAERRKMSAVSGPYDISPPSWTN